MNEWRLAWGGDGQENQREEAMTLTKRCPIQNAQLVVVVVVVYSDSDSRVMIIQWMVERMRIEDE